MHIALDAMGGDLAPKATVKGALEAAKELPEEAVISLIGLKESIEEVLEKEGGQPSNIRIIPCQEAITMDEHPVKALSSKPHSSIAIGYGLLKQQKINVFCSAGNTGAMHVGAMFTIKAIEGIIRPAIAGFIPTTKGGYKILVDVGANADCKPDVLSQFATMGYLFSKHVMDVGNPRVGLMNLGKEKAKGSMLTQAAYPLLELNPVINFVGNMEGGDVFEDTTDVVICDGFTGNVILKMGESWYGMMKQRGFIDDFLELFNYENLGASPILGVNGNVMIAHGKSTSTAIKNMLLLSLRMIGKDIAGKIKAGLEENAKEQEK